MAHSSSSHTLIFSLLLLPLLLTSFPTNNAAYHSLPYSSPSSAPAPAPTHHHAHHPGGHHHRHPHIHPPTQPPTYTSAPPAKPPTYHSVPAPSKPPTLAPAKPPTYHSAAPPSKPPPTVAPAYPPVKPPMKPLPERKLVAVEGVVYCKNCSFAGVNTFLGASPLPGALVELRCKNTKYNVRLQTAKTDKNGYFFLLAPPLVTTYGAHKCLVSLVPTTKHNKFTTLPCTHPSPLNGGVTGAPLILAKSPAQPGGGGGGGGVPLKALPFALYTVGPFAFEPPKCLKH